MIKYADLTLSIVCLNDYLPKARKDIFYWSIDDSKYKPIYETNNKKIKIVHSTNHPKYKGTRFFIDICQRLKKEGYPIEFLFIKDLKNEEAMKIYREADIIAVQLLTGWHGYFSVEAMALGKPVLSYIAKKEWLPNWIECPIVNTNPDNLYEKLLMLIKDKNLRIELGERGRKYVEEVHSLEKVGARFDKIYKEIW